jgi:hypothetical protein
MPPIIRALRRFISYVFMGIPAWKYPESGWDRFFAVCRVPRQKAIGFVRRSKMRRKKREDKGRKIRGKKMGVGR